MIKLTINKTDLKIKIEGMTDDISAEMLMAIRLFNDSLKEKDEETARAFQRILLESQTYIFGHNQTRKVFEEMREKS